MKKLLAFILTLVMVASTFTMLPLSVSAGDGDTTPTLLIYSDGYAGQPAGSGTKDDPYKIASADDLLWMSKTIGTGGTSGSNVFEDKYFEQTDNIDLGGNILPAIGYYTGNSKPYRFESDSMVFGGNYDGNHKIISNGYFAIPKTSSIKTDANNNAWGVGLFGVIYGATIKNVNLSNMQLYKESDSHKISVAGMVVGIAIGNSSTANSSCNVIENCNVDSACSMKSSNTTGRNDDSASMLHYRWGGIVGFAMDTTVRSCVNNGAISVNGAIGTVGGIVGCMTSGVITNCENNGNIIVSNTDTTATNRGTRSYGGIVGFIPDLTTHSDTLAANIGVTIKNSCNGGNINITTFGNNICYLGGIIGSALALQSNTYSIEQCYNFGNITQSTSTTIGSIIGTATKATNTTVQLTVNKSYSVDINGTEEDILYVGDVTATNCSVSTDTVKLAKEADMVAACDLGIQAHSTDAGKYRFFATIDGLNWDEAGFNITVNNGNKSVTKEFFVTVAYNSIEENGVTVTDINGRKFIVLVLENVEADWTFEINAYVEDSTGTYTTTTWTGEFG